MVMAASAIRRFRAHRERCCARHLRHDRTAAGVAPARRPLRERVTGVELVGALAETVGKQRRLSFVTCWAEAATRRS